ncbi:hypothetical protein [Dyadobacter bucti]|uniref:hypothetical protein n=1 Tax=Dyadobacter bucti TaxID=2572203 RepID=UPI003F6F562E
MIFAQTQAKILSNGKLQKLLESLYCCYRENGMILDKVADESSFDWNGATDLQLISFDADFNNWVIEPNYLFAITVLRNQVQDLQLKVPNDVNQLAEYYETATELPEEKGRTGITLLADKIMELLLALTYESTGETFADWIPKLDSERASIINFEFLQAYCRIADTLPLDAASIVEACHQFFTWNDLMIFPNVNPLINRLVARDVNEAERLTLDLPAEFRIIRTLLLNWLIKHVPEKGWTIVQSQFEDFKNQSYILGAIHQFEFAEESRAWEALDLIRKCNSTIEETRHHVPYAITRILARINFDDVTFVNQCFQELNKMAATGDLPTVKHVLLSLGASVEKYPSQTIALAIDLLKNPSIKYEHLVDHNSLISFDSLLAETPDPNLVFEFFQHFAFCHPFRFDRDLFQGTVNHLQSIIESSAELCEMVLNLVIHDEGEIRYLGIELLNCFKNRPFQAQFAQKLTKLDPIQQYKLWMSILSLESSPQNSLVWLLPLLHSKNEIVAEALLCKLEELTESYHDDVIKIVEKYSEDNERIVQTAVLRLKAHYAAFSDMLDKKNSIVEFHPSICQSGVYERFREVHRQNMNQRMAKSRKAYKGILNLFKQVTLVKGGGWKHSDSSDVTKLRKFQSSYTWPRLHLLNPERFDLERRFSIGANWKSDKTDFEEWIIE